MPSAASSSLIYQEIKQKHRSTLHLEQFWPFSCGLWLCFMVLSSSMLFITLEVQIYPQVSLSSTTIKIRASPRRLKTWNFQISRLLSVFQLSMVIKNQLMTTDMVVYLLESIDEVTNDIETESLLCIDALMKNKGWQETRKLSFLSALKKLWILNTMDSRNLYCIVEEIHERRI